MGPGFEMGIGGLASQRNVPLEPIWSNLRGQFLDLIGTEIISNAPNM